MAEERETHPALDEAKELQAISIRKLDKIETTMLESNSHGQ
ncbi:hypothetical protein [Microbispora hainanensis]|uniref:Uncharacterized protein n=1 Tax=Microbispora hainanensis TaxID=568844 RepID=A0ABZ1SSM4_9ACTN|nr:hypothetical protein [Microbispora hainanensis]